MISSATAPRYDRITSLVLVILIGLAVIFLIDGSPNTIQIYLGGDLPVITLSWFLIASLVVLTCAGADLLARSHPQLQNVVLPVINLGFARVEIAPAFWVLPSLSVIGSFAFFRVFSQTLPGIAFALALLAAGGGLLAVLVAQHYSLDRRSEVRQRAQTALAIMTYLIAFGCFSAIYYTRYRTLYSASLVAITGALLAYPLLAATILRSPLLLALIVGLMLAEATWALNYWATTFLLAGTLLLVIFYIAVSLLQHAAAGALPRRLLIEYGMLGGGLGLVVIYATLMR
jgi:hypothetical protein